MLKENIELFVNTGVCSVYTNYCVLIGNNVLKSSFVVDRRDVLWNGTVRSSVRPSVCLSVRSNALLYDAVMVVVRRKLGRKYRTNRVLNPGPVVCESITLSAHRQPLRLQFLYKYDFNIPRLTALLFSSPGL